MADEETTQTSAHSALRFLVSHLAAIILAVLVVIFIAQNTHSTNVDFLWLSFDSAMWFALLVTTVVGFLIGILTARRRAHRKD